MNKSIRLCGNKTFSWFELQKLRIMAPNHMGISIYGISHGCKDTDCMYGLYTQNKIKKSRICEIESFIEGFVLGIHHYY